MKIVRCKKCKSRDNPAWACISSEARLLGVKKGHEIRPLCYQCFKTLMRKAGVYNPYAKAYGDAVADARKNSEQKLGHCLAID